MIDNYENILKVVANNGLAIVLLVYCIYRGDQIIQGICEQNKAMNDLIANDLNEIKYLLKELKQAMQVYGKKYSKKKTRVKKSESEY